MINVHKFVFLYFLFFLLLFSYATVSVNATEEKYVIFIDPGHGGMDGGCSYEDLIEKNVNQNIGLKLRDVLEEKGAISAETAMYLAKNVRILSDSNIGVGITGIAGPDGGTPKKPVGTVCFGVYLNGKLDSKTVSFGSIGRNEVRNEASKYIFRALDYLLKKEENN